MPMNMIPSKLKSGDEIRIVAPSRSLAIISKDTRIIGDARFKELGLKLSFGKHVNEMDDFASSSIKSRVQDLHDAFNDKKIKAIISVIGGFNCNQLLRYLDYELIKNNPKILIGYSDTTALQNAIYAKTGLVTYSGPAYSTFGMKKGFEYTLDYFKRCLFSNELIEIKPSVEWSDDTWYKNQESREFIKNKGFYVINKGTIIGANLCTLNLLQGTEYMPSLEDSVLFLEDDEESNPLLFDRDLQSLIHQPGFNKVKGIVIGRFQKVSKVDYNLITQIIKSKKELDKIPVIYDADFGHTSPMITFPIGGTVEINASKNPSIKIIEH